MAPTSPMASSSTQAVLTLVFGATATIISTVTVWQGYKFWKTWHGSNDHRDSTNVHMTDIELDFAANGPLPPQTDSIVVSDEAPSLDGAAAPFQLLELPAQTSTSTLTLPVSLVSFENTNLESTNVRKDGRRSPQNVEDPDDILDRGSRRLRCSRMTRKFAS